MSSTVLSNAGMASWAIAGMFMFITAFALMAVRALATPRAELERQARLPLDEEGEDA
jgi:uncharacterized protein (DUF58 family)